jgi:hypothetical protein
MSFVRLNPEDFVVSSDSVTTTLWSNFTPTLTTFFTSSTGVGGTTTGSAAYLNVYQSNPAITASAEIQFSIAYGRADSSGSAPYNLLVPQNTPTRVTYGQYRTLVNGDENTNFNFGLNNTSSVDLYVLNIERARYKDHLFLGTFNLNLSVLTGTNPSDNQLPAGADKITLTNNSNNVSTVTYCDAGRVYDIVSGTNGAAVNTVNTNNPGVTAGYTPSGSYGWYLPDVGLILLNPRALALPFASGGINLQPYSASVNTTYNGDLTGPSGSIAKLFYAISGSAGGSGSFQINSEENISSDYVFVRVKNTEFNYSTNPSIISGSGEFVYPSLVNNPQTYPTTVGLYNDNNELLAVAKLSKALPKDFTKEALIRVKLDF